MAHQQSFGRRARTETQPRPRAVAEKTQARTIPELPPDPIFPPAQDGNEISVEDEIEEWKKARPYRGLPWRQIAVMASLCFGFASFVLPDSINDFMQAPLIILSVLSLCGGIAGFKKFGG